MRTNVLKSLIVPSKQLVKYGIVGIIQNGAGYFIYLLLTWYGIDPKLVVAVSYPVGMYISFIGNKNFTFKSKGLGGRGSAVRYFFVHVVAYFLNLILLFLLSDVLGYPHQIVQVFCIGVISLYLFAMFKFFVFRG